MRCVCGCLLWFALGCVLLRVVVRACVVCWVGFVFISSWYVCAMFVLFWCGLLLRDVLVLW